MGNHNPIDTTSNRHLFSVILALVATAGMSWTACAQPADGLPLKLSYEDLTAKVWAPLPTPPPTAAVFAIDPGVVPIGLIDLQDTFNVTGNAHDAVFPRGAKHVANGSFHILFMPDGAGEYTDTNSDHLGNVIHPMPEDDLWYASDKLLVSLGVLDAPPFDLTREKMLNEQCDSCSTPALSRQQALYRQRIDGLATFGEGSIVSVRFAGDDIVVGFSRWSRSTPCTAGCSASSTATIGPRPVIPTWCRRPWT